MPRQFAGKRHDIDWLATVNNVAHDASGCNIRLIHFGAIDLAVAADSLLGSLRLAIVLTGLGFPQINNDHIFF